MEPTFTLNYHGLSLVIDRRDLPWVTENVTAARDAYLRHRRPYTYELRGDEQTNTFPWAVIDQRTGESVAQFTHRSVADRTADQMNLEHRS